MHLLLPWDHREYAWPCAAGMDACRAAVRDSITVTGFQRLNLGLCRWYFPVVGVWCCYLPTGFHMRN